MDFFVVIDVCVCVCIYIYIYIYIYTHTHTHTNSKNVLVLSFSSKMFQSYSRKDKLGTKTSVCLSVCLSVCVSNVFNQKSRSSIFTALDVVQVGQKK